MWKEVDSVLYFVDPKFVCNPIISIFNFYDTLIHTNKTYIQSTSFAEQCDVRFVCYKPKIIKKLHELHRSGVSIVIYQSVYRYNENNQYKIAFDIFKKKIDIPMLAFFSTTNNKYAKPLTGIWTLINTYYKKHKICIDKEHSLFIGHLAGRMTYKGIKIDTNSNDRLFANNIGIKFTTPDRFFRGDKSPIIWKNNSGVISIDERARLVSEQTGPTPNILDEINILCELYKDWNPESYLILISGMSPSGKTELATKLQRKWNSEFKLKNMTLSNIHILSHNDMDISTMESNLTEHLQNKQSVIVEVLYKDIVSIVRISMLNKTPVLFVNITTTINISKLLDHIRVESAHTHTIKLKNANNWKNLKVADLSKLACVRCVELPLRLDINNSKLWLEY